MTTVIAVARPPRVLSLLSAATEIVCRLGCAHLLVGRSHGCDDPPFVTALPVVTAPRVDPNAASHELDQAVRAQAVSGGPIYHIRSELVCELRPDVIITQDQCRICAVTAADVAAACGDGSPTTAMITIKPTTLDDVLDDVRTIARALGVSERGDRLVKLLSGRLGALRVLTSQALGHQVPRVAHLEWLAPLMGSGYWIAECVEAATCQMVHGSRGSHAQIIACPSQLSDADVIIIAPCGFGLERTHVELTTLGLLKTEEWCTLPAVCTGSVAVADGNLYFNRSSCGVVEAAEMIAEIAHPELCGLFGHHGNRWVRLSELAAFCGREGAAPAFKNVDLAAGTGPAEKDPMVTCVGIADDMPAANAQTATHHPATRHVQLQIERMRANDFVGAFELNSAANRERLGNANSFEAIVKSNPSFSVLAAAEGSIEFLNVDNFSVALQVRNSEKSHGFIFDISESKGGSLATDGVRIAC